MNIYQKKINRLTRIYMDNIEHRNFFFDISYGSARKEIRRCYKNKVKQFW